MKYILLILTLFALTNAGGQNTFQRVDDFEVGAITKHFEIWETNNRVYLGGVQFQNFKKPGTYIAEYSLDGELINFVGLISKDSSNIIWDYSTQLNDSIIYRIGFGHNLGEGISKIFLYRCENFNTIVRVAEYKSLYYNDPVDANKQQISIGGICSSDGSIYFALSESVPKSIGLNVLRIFKVDITGKLIWQKEYSSTTMCIEAQKINSDGFGGIYLSSVWYEACNLEIKIEKKMSAHIMHFNSNGNLLNHIETPNDKSKYFIQQIDSLWWGASDFIIDSNDFVLATAHCVELYMPNRTEWLPAIISLASSGKINWSIYFENQRDVISTFSRIIRTKNKDGYVAVGSSIDTTNGIYASSGIIAKISLEGDEMWRRYYSHWNKEGPTSQFYDVSEAADGGFYIVGEAVDSINSSSASVKGWFLKVDSLGCLIPGCQLNSKLEDVKNDLFSAKLYPNPVKNGQVSIYIGEQNIHNNLSIDLINLIGSTVKSWTVNHYAPTTYTFDLSSIESGTYFVNIRTDNKFWTGKLVVIGSAN